jgi:3-keto-5-aminohexanoate cleavage enzyme
LPPENKRPAPVDALKVGTLNPPSEGDNAVTERENPTSESNSHTLEHTPAPVVLCVAPNGARRTKSDHPDLPMTAAEIGREASRCMEAGATAIHLHVRDQAGAHTLDVERFRDAIAHVKAAVRDRMLIQVTTEAMGRYQPQEQMAVVKALRPPAASVALRELVPDESHLPEATAFFAWATQHGIALQFIVYTPDEATALRALAHRGALGCEHPNALFVLGRHTAGQRSRAVDLLPFLSNWPPAFPWSVCAFGATEAQCATAAMGLGGHVRVGFENNLMDTSGGLALHNAQLVANVADLARRSGRGVATADQARLIYGVAHA